MSGYRGRFAPSPSGPLHFGSLVAALASWLAARSVGGEWLVRIEDVDRARTVDGASARILTTLQAFGLEHDGPIVRQSERSDLYDAALTRLRDAGAAFACACSRADLVTAGGLHPPACLRQPGVGTATAWRMRAGDASIGFDDRVFGHVVQDLRREVGDFVVRRADGDHAYQLAVVVDDAEQGITDVVRGADLLDSTPRQILLRRALGLADTTWMHVPLVLDANGRKLSKSDRDRAIDDADPLPALREALAFLGQSIPPQGSVSGVVDAAARAFEVDRIIPRRHAHAAMQKD